MSVTALPPMRVPTLTEVVEWSALAAEEPTPCLSVPDAAAPDADLLPVLSEAVLAPDWQAAAAEPAPAPIDEAHLTQRILDDLQRQVDLMLDQRLRLAMEPVLNRLAETLARDAREELASALREMVARAVSQAVIRHRSASSDGDDAG